MITMTSVISGVLSLALGCAVWLNGCRSHQVIEDTQATSTVPDVQRSYYEWLANQLLLKSEKQELFSSSNGVYQLELEWDLGRNDKWYILEVLTSDRTRLYRGIIWKHIGDERVSPATQLRATDLIELTGVSGGEQLFLDLYIYPRDVKDHWIDVDIEEVLNSRQTSFIMRLPVCLY